MHDTIMDCSTTIIATITIVICIYQHRSQTSHLKWHNRIVIETIILQYYCISIRKKKRERHFINHFHMFLSMFNIRTWKLAQYLSAKKEMIHYLWIDYDFCHMCENIVSVWVYFWLFNFSLRLEIIRKYMIVIWI